MHKWDVVIVTHIHGNLRNCSWSKYLLGEIKPMTTCYGAQTLLPQVLGGDQVNESVTCSNTRPYWTTGHWFTNIYVYEYLKILIWSGLIIYYIAPFPRACALNWYSVQCCHPQIYQVLFVIMKRAVGITAKRMMLIASFSVLALFESRSTEKNLQ